MNDVKSNVYAQKVELLLRLIPIVMLRKEVEELNAFFLTLLIYGQLPEGYRFGKGAYCER